MEHLFFECAVRAALFVGATAIVLHAMRVKAAAARHGVWAGVVVLMLLLPIWTAWGPRVSLRLLPPNVPLDRVLSVPAAILREQFHLRNGDLFKVSEVRAGLERVKRSYDAQGYGDAKDEPDITIDDAHHLINVTLRITEGLHTK